MKTNIFNTACLAVFLLALRASISFAQPLTYADRSQKPDTAPPTRIKNSAPKAIEVEGIKIDKRIVKYYREGELENIPKEKAIKLGHIYLDSYQLLNASEQNEACQNYLKEKFDLGDYNHLRMEDKRVEVEVNSNGCFFKIALFSWNEIDEMR